MRNTRTEKIKKLLLSVMIIITLPLVLNYIFTENSAYKKIDNQAQVINMLTGEITEQYFYFSKNNNLKPKVKADAYTVGDLDTGEIIISQNGDKVYPIASLSKLMTATITKENPKEGLITFNKKILATEGENGNFRQNEKIDIKEILYPLLLESSNHAGEAIAGYFGRDVFLQKMNEKTKELKMNSTSFADPTGLSAKNLSNTKDLFKLTKYIKDTYPELLQITTEKSYKNKNHIWFSNNQFLNNEGYLGGKSGYTDKAEQTVVSTFSLPLGEKSSRNIAIALLSSPDRRKDVENMVKYLKGNIYYGEEKDANQNWVKAKAPAEDVDYNGEPVEIAFLGDMMLDRGVRSSVNKNYNGDYSKLFSKMGILKNFDIVFANLEGTASDQGKDIRNLYSFRMDPSVIPALRGAGIDILSMANNHVGDWGRDAYVDTLARLKENEIAYTGGGQNIEEAKQPTIIEKNGKKIGFLGFSDVGPTYMKATENEAGVLLASNPDFDTIIRNAKKQVDYLIVSFHFGDEYKTKHNERQETLAHRAIDNGAKIVVGHHPHVIQDTEVYNNGYIAYSLGNFIFDQYFSSATMEGMLLKLKINADGSMTAQKNTVKLNRVFQPDNIIRGKEEKIKFVTPKPPTKIISQ
ncbi:MAG: CapA family protein [Candidatus Paceibacterota bacterium]|jgi:poly-gamma-glutamate synthesis protein (capsule biosynthesis protein)